MKAKKIVGIISFVAILSIIAVSFAATNEQNQIMICSTPTEQSNVSLDSGDNHNSLVLDRDLQAYGVGTKPENGVPDEPIGVGTQPENGVPDEPIGVSNTKPENGVPDEPIGVGT
ncbi:MAG: hypothetical protein ACTSSG_09405 [Candidatus Heimdallarchaeaceae archaeon]